MTWPRVAYPTSTLRLLIEFPGIVAIAYVAASVCRTAPFALGGMMLVAAILMLSLSTEAISIGYAVALLSVGPLASWLGVFLHRRWSVVAPLLVALLLMGDYAEAQEATGVADPTKSRYGEKTCRTGGGAWAKPTRRIASTAAS
jgi:hypothetical protein